MGVKYLWDILESCKKTLPLHHLQNKRVCVDLSCWIVQLHTVSKSHCPAKEKVYLKGLFHRLRALIALNCSLIFVSDGSIPAIKVSTYRRRLNSKNEPLLDAGNPQDASSVKRNMGSEFSYMIKEAKLLGSALGIPCLDGIEEAEAQCALLSSESLCDGCFTSDSDVFLFGARTVYRDICLGEGGYVVCYEMDDIEAKLGLGRNSLITLAILLGGDYNQGVRGFGPGSACQLVKSIGDSIILQRFASEGLSIIKKHKDSKKKVPNLICNDKENYCYHEKKSDGCAGDLPTDNPFLQVINAYLKPKCHSADSNVVHRALALYPFNRSQLHQVCAQLFEWPPEKTDEYILPKIAERNLRRFANLRSSSSIVGVNLPINEIPVKCPVSSIIKQRKIQGRDYFEVNWEDSDGLKSSAVPADLVENACAEKIVEFHERKAQKQKPTRRPRANKADSKAAEIEEKLQKLLLEIEQASTTTTTSNAATLRLLSPEKIHTASQVNVAHQRRLLHTRSESSSQECTEVSHKGNPIPGCATTTTTTEVIDLVSPPPRTHAQEEASKWQRARSTEVIIELSDSDNEASPEHAIRARELRLFMASIRDEIA